jgi:hypothetical protein
MLLATDMVVNFTGNTSGTGVVVGEVGMSSLQEGWSLASSGTDVKFLVNAQYIKREARDSN